MKLYVSCRLLHILDAPTDTLEIVRHPVLIISEQTLLTRQKDKAEGFHELGCKTVIGNLQDYDLIKEECKKVSWTSPLTSRR